jgi:SAM-dependent methyltransferase
VSGLPTQLLPIEEHYADYHRGEPPPAPEVRYHEWLGKAERLLGVGRLLEVGAGRAGFVRVALDRGWTVCATEVSVSGLDELRLTRAEVFAGDVSQAHYPSAAFDLVVSLEVVEHLPNPLDHLREFHRVTRPSGLLLLTTPNLAGLSGRLLGTRWRVVTPEHVGYFSPRTLRWALGRAGYRDARVSSRSLDVSTWRASLRTATPQFDPHRSAALRDAVEDSLVLRTMKSAVNVALRMTDLGDSLMAWARS